MRYVVGDNEKVRAIVITDIWLNFEIKIFKVRERNHCLKKLRNDCPRVRKSAGLA